MLFLQFRTSGIFIYITQYFGINELTYKLNYQLLRKVFLGVKHHIFMSFKNAQLHIHRISILKT